MPAPRGDGRAICPPSFYLAGAEPSTRTGRLLDVIAERLDAPALPIDADRMLD